MYKYNFSPLNVEPQEVTSRKQYPECFVRVINLPNLPAGRALFDQISTLFLQQIEGPQ